MPKDPKAPPSSRIARTGRVGGLVAGQGLRWAGTRAANLVRSPERAEAATGERAAALARELVEQLGQMRGAAMKIGQVLSTVDFTAIPEGEREEFKRTLAALRDEVPPLPYKRMEKLLREELGMPLSEAFEDFEHEAFAAASIGQVHRAVTRDGRRVAVKVQYPGVAEAVETDLRNLQVLLPLVKRLAPGLDVKALAAELRERIAEELDYEIEAQNHRAVERAWRGHPYAYVPPVDTGLSSRRVLVTELIEGKRFEEVKALGEAERDRFAEIVFRFFFGTLNHLRRAAGDPHPGNYLLRDDGRVGFLDFGLMRVVDADYLEQERAIAQAAVAGDAAGVHAALAAAGYLPDPRAFEPERVLAQIRTAGEWYFTPGFKRLSPGYVAELMERSLLAALGLLRGDAPGDRAAAGAADPPHGGARARRPRRAARGRRLGRARGGVLRRRAAVDADRASRTRRSGRTTPWRGARTPHRLRRPCAGPSRSPSWPSPCSPPPPAARPAASTSRGSSPSRSTAPTRAATCRCCCRPRCARTSAATSPTAPPAPRAGASTSAPCATATRRPSASSPSSARVQGGRPSGGHRVALPRGRTGRFHPLSCGASCSPASIEWRERGALYSIQAKVARRELVRMASSAIRNGPR